MSDYPFSFVSCALALTLPIALWFWVNPNNPPNPYSSSRSTKKLYNPGTFPTIPLQPQPHPKNKKKKKKKPRPQNKKHLHCNPPPSSSLSSPSSSSSSTLDYPNTLIIDSTSNEINHDPTPSTTDSDSEQQQQQQQQDDDDDITASVNCLSMDSESDWIAVSQTLKGKKHSSKLHVHKDMNPWSILTQSTSSSSISSMSSTYPTSSSPHSTSAVDHHVRVISLVGSSTQKIPSMESSHPIPYPQPITKSQRKHMKRRILIKSQTHANTQVQNRRLMLHRLDQQLMAKSSTSKKRTGPNQHEQQPVWKINNTVPLEFKVKDKVAESFLWTTKPSSLNSESDQ